MQLTLIGQSDGPGRQYGREEGWATVFFVRVFGVHSE